MADFDDAEYSENCAADCRRPGGELADMVWRMGTGMMRAAAGVPPASRPMGVREAERPIHSAGTGPDSGRCEGRGEISRPLIPTPEKTQADAWKILGPKMWAELHARPKLFNGDMAAESKWLASFDARIGCGSCRTDWLAWKKLNPVDLSSPEAYGAWGMRGHNAVNVRLGKPPFIPPEK